MMSPSKCDGLRWPAAIAQSLNSSSSAPEKLFRLASRWIVALLVVSTACSAGCGRGGDGIAPVHGVVTLDGKPLTEGFVFVSPAEGKMAKGAIQSDGTFVLGTNSNSDGAKVGSHPVSVKPPPAQEGMPPSATAKLLPRHYTRARTSGIKVDVLPNTDNELTIELSTQ